MPSNSSLTLLSTLSPPSVERTWLTAPHPRLPIVATCCADKTVRIYSLVNFNLLSTISGGHKRSVRSCAWKPLVKGESVLATGSFDATVGIWRRWDAYGSAGTENGDAVVNGSGPAGSTADEEIDMTQDENEEEEEWRFAVLLDGHDSEVKSVSWSPAGSLLATCSRDKSIWIWEDLDDGDNNFETVAVMQEHSGDVKCVAWHPTEECLASGSYDDTIRMWREDIDDWGQVSCLKGHEGTVWFVDWESGEGVCPEKSENEEPSQDRRNQWTDQHSLCGPRLASCSDDRTVRIWRKEARQNPAGQPSSAGVPSIIRPAGIDETWHEEATLPTQHDLSVYCVAWSKRTGLLASTGADGRIVIYQERFANGSTSASAPNGADTDVDMDRATPATESANGSSSANPISPDLRTEWHVLATIEAAHGIYEVNHICWANRVDKDKLQGIDEEVLLSTGDDGSVKVWKVEY